MSKVTSAHEKVSHSTTSSMLTISEQSDTVLVRGKDRVRDEKNQTSQQLSDEWRTEVTTRRRKEERELSESLWHRVCQKSSWFVGTEKTRGNDNTHPFCYCVGEGERDGGIILMA